MGNSEYAVKVNTPQDIQYWLQVIEDHNEHAKQDVSCGDEYVAGEEIYLTCVLDFSNAYTRSKRFQGRYLVFGNGGGRCSTSSFLEKRQRPKDVILYPFDKPDNWFECNDMLWKPRPADEDFFDNVLCYTKDIIDSVFSEEEDVVENTLGA